MKSKVVLVTGGSSGIGQATAKMFAERGFITYATSRHVDSLAAVARLGCHPLRLDVTDGNSIHEVVTTIKQAHGGVDILVNNAGYGQLGPLEEITPNELRRQFETNVFGLLHLCQQVIPHMRAEGWGRIINVSSVGGEVTFPGAGAYHMSKYAVESLTHALRYEVKSFGIDVVSIQPGGVATGFVDASEQYLGKATANGPYTVFRQNVVNGTRRMFEPGSAFGILTPEQVAATIVRAANARRPQTRYRVGMLAKVTPRFRQWIPDRWWDSMMGQLFPMT